jgi:hypothetical protein
MYGEDIDLSYKILKAGYKNHYFGDATVIHFKGESTLRDKQYARRFYGAMQIFYKKHFKKHLIFDMLVWVGIRVVYLFRKVKRDATTSVLQYAFISNTINKKLEAILPKKVLRSDVVTNFEPNTELILDANFLSYKTIIEILKTNSSSKQWTYKILPHDSNFILGSDTTISRGEIIQF